MSIKTLKQKAKKPKSQKAKKPKSQKAKIKLIVTLLLYY